MAAKYHGVLDDNSMRPLSGNPQDSVNQSLDPRFRDFSHVQSQQSFGTVEHPYTIEVALIRKQSWRKGGGVYK